MFRVIFVRNHFLKKTLKKTVQINVSRNLAINCGRKIAQKSSFVLERIRVQKWHMQNLIRTYASDLPSHTRVPLPALSPTMEEGTLISWEKKEGDKLNEGDLLAEIETDKATMAFETPEEGYLAKILIPAGTKGVPIGKLVCIIVENAEDVAAFKDFKDDGAPAQQPAPATPPAPPQPAQLPPLPPTDTPVSPPPVPSVSSHSPAGSRVYASPMAKRLAEQRNIRLQGKGTGLFDSITSSDLDKMSLGDISASDIKTSAEGVSTSSPYIDIPVSNIRGVIAKRLLQSKQNIPHYYLTIEMNAEKLNALRSKFNKKLEKDGVKLSVNDFIIKACALASKKVPEANSSWLDSVIRQYKNVDVSVAVATDRGLITPIIFEANNKGLVAISKEVKNLALKARDGKLKPNEFQGGTISISNLGMFNVNHFTAIINPPQSCILAVGSTTSKLVLDEDSEKGFKEEKFMTVTLSCDHRVVDGAVGAQWLQAFRQYIEDPETMIL